MLGCVGPRAIRPAIGPGMTLSPGTPGTTLFAAFGFATFRHFFILGGLTAQVRALGRMGLRFMGPALASLLLAFLFGGTGGRVTRRRLHSSELLLILAPVAERIVLVLPQAH